MNELFEETVLPIIQLVDDGPEGIKIAWEYEKVWGQADQAAAEALLASCGKWFKLVPVPDPKP